MTTAAEWRPTCRPESRREKAPEWDSGECAKELGNLGGGWKFRRTKTERESWRCCLSLQRCRNRARKPTVIHKLPRNWSRKPSRTSPSARLPRSCALTTKRRACCRGDCCWNRPAIELSRRAPDLKAFVSFNLKKLTQ